MGDGGAEAIAQALLLGSATGARGLGFRVLGL